MKNASPWVRSLVLLTLAGLLLAPATSAMVREVSFKELTRLSETTMEVVVVNSYAKWNAEHTAIFTHYVVEPIRQVGGRDRGAQFELLFAGGRATDGKQMIVTEVPTLEIDGQYILFLHPGETRHAAPTVGLWQGALRVVSNPETKKSVVVDLQGRLVEKDSEGNLVRGRSVKVDSRGFLTFVTPEPEPGMDNDPILRDPQGRILPLRNSRIRVESQAQAETREPVDPDTLMTMVEHFRQDIERSR